MTLNENSRLVNIASKFRTLSDLWRDNRGMALIELAYTLPIFLGFGLVGIEYTSVVLAHQKTERVASTVADQIASNQIAPNERQIGDMFAGVELIANPYEFGTDGNAIITAVIGVYDDDADEVQNKVAWQRCLAIDSHASRVGTQWTGTDDIADGPGVTLPDGLELGKNQMVIVSEVFLPYEPIIGRGIVGDILPAGGPFYETSVFRTRGSAIMNITPVTGVAVHSC